MQNLLQMAAIAVASHNFNNLLGELPDNVSELANESFINGVTPTPALATAVAKTTAEFQDVFAKEDVTVDLDVVDAAVESFLLNAKLDRDLYSRVASLENIPAATSSIGERPENFAANENFDDAIITSLGSINAANTILNYSANHLTEVAKFIAQVDVGNKNALQVTSDNVRIVRNLEHKDGTPVEFTQVSHWDLLDTRIDLGTPRIYPNAEVANVNGDALFIDPTVVAPWEVLSTTGDAVQTAPVLFGMEFDYKGASTSNKQIATHNIYDITDELNPGMAIESVYVNFDGQILRFDYINRASAFADKTAQGQATDYVWVSKEQFVVTDQTKDIADTVITKITIPAGFRIVLEINVTGTTNIRTSKTQLHLTNIDVLKVIDADGNTVTDAALIQGIKDEVAKYKDTPELCGYVLDVRLQNSNIRQQGWIIDSNEESENIYVKVQEPIRALRPVNRSDNSRRLMHIRQAHEIHAVRRAITLLEDTRATLARNTDNGTLSSDVAVKSTNPASFYLNNSYLEDTLDLGAVLNSRRHGERAEDLAALTAGYLNDAISQLSLDSRLGLASKGLNTSMYNNKVTWVIVGNTRSTALIKDHMNLLDSSVKWDVATIDSNRLDDVLYVVPRFAKGYHPFNFAMNISGSERIIGSVQTIRGATSNTLVSTPVSTLWANAKIMYVLKITGRKEALGKICC